tara:strand:+ start:98 stop:700 length:603 start_codon:yes stop_codon:yes gene_type:complete
MKIEKLNNLISHHFHETSKAISKNKTFNKKIIKLAELIKFTHKKNSKIFVAGNGGSNADAEHFVGEMICTFNDRKRIGFDAETLHNNFSAMTAWINDFDHLTFLERQVENKVKKNDIIIFLSTGGGNVKEKISMNLVYAAKKAKSKGAKIISLVGKSGGYLKSISDIDFHIESKNTAVIQECHMSILHSVCICLDHLLKR